MQIPLANYSWLLLGRETLECLENFDTDLKLTQNQLDAIRHYDMLLFEVLTNNVTGQQLESIVLAASGGAAAYNSLCVKNESTHARASVSLLLQLVQLIDWSHDGRVDPRQIVAEMTRIKGRLNNLEKPIALHNDILQAILLGRYARHDKFAPASAIQPN